MNKIKLAALQLQLNKTDNLDFLLNQLDDLIKRRDDLDLIILSELAVGGVPEPDINLGRRRDSLGDGLLGRPGRALLLEHGGREVEAVH